MRLLTGTTILFTLGMGSAQVITTVAGTSWSFPQSSLPATAAPLGIISGTAVDAKGNVYATDYENALVVEVSPNGTLTVVAGNGIPGYSGDGGPATSASFGYPEGLAVDSAGNIYVADTGNNLIREISNGIITTIAGNGAQGYSGDGRLATSAALNTPTSVAVDSAGNIYIADFGNNRIREISNGIISTVAGSEVQGYSGDGGPATSAALNEPYGVAVDAVGNIYIADRRNNCIRQVSKGIIRTIAGNGAAGYSGDGGPATSASLAAPLGVAVDAAGNVYIADTVSSFIREVSNGVIRTIAGTGVQGFSGDGGPATSGSLNSPSGVAVDSAGNVYIADYINERIREVSGGVITTLAGNGAYRFSGDGGLATSASLNQPNGIALDSTGNLYIADTNNSRIRKVSNGIITTIAGNGVFGSSGDGGPATSAALNVPLGVVVDSSGNLYIADPPNNRIREVSNGIITTIAGNGGTGYSGDGGPAKSASLNNPSGVAVDSAGNVYIADTGNNVVRKVSSGSITTVAGNGVIGFSGNGGPATGASLNSPRGVVVDSAGNIYIADTDNHCVREVSNGTITIFAGNDVVGFSGDGGLATRALLTDPVGIAFDAAGNFYIADSGNGRVRVVLTSAPAAAVAPQQLQFTASSNGAPSQPQTLSVTSPIDGVGFSASIPSDAAWLQLSPASGASPRLIQVIADPTGLAPQAYQTTITIQTPYANPTSSTVAVTFNVTAAQPPSLSVDKQSLSFTFPEEGSARSQTITVSNSGGGTLPFTATAATTSGGNWLSVSPANAQALPGSPITVTVTANPTGLAPGAYTGQVAVTAGIESETIAVTMTISTLGQAILLSQSGLSFLAVQNGGVVPAQSFAVMNIGTGVVNWTASTTTLTGGNWLEVTPASSSSNAAAETSPRVTVSVDASQLTPGAYYGLVRVTAPGAANSPQVLTVFLQVLAPGSNVPPAVEPAQLVFTATTGAESPGSQTIQVYNIVAQAKSFQSQVSADPGLLLTILPQDATLDPQESTQIVVQPVTTNLHSGVYNGTVTLQFSDGTVSAVKVSVIISNSAGATSSVRGEARPSDSGGCSPSMLIPALTSLGASFQVSAAWPAALIVTVKDDCGMPMQPTGAVTVSFSNGDPRLSLLSQGAGTWEGTWNTTNATPNVILTINAGYQGLAGNAVVNGSLASQQQPPVFPSAGIVSVASAVSFSALAPGSAISIYGSLLAESPAAPGALPLPTQIGNTDTQVFVSGTTAAGTSTGLMAAPLYYVSPNQVNALIPYEVSVDTSLQLLIQRGPTLSSPVQINTAPAQPSIFSAGGRPGSAGVIQVYPASGAAAYFASPSAPAHAGDTLVVYCTGLGAVQPAVADGAAPGAQLSSTTSAVQLMIGGQAAHVAFAGLTPGFAGLYQVNAVVPSGVPTGANVPLTLSIDGQTSGLVTLPVQ